MPENSEQKSLYHFSKKVLALSLAFIAINLAWYGLIVFQRDDISFKPVAPKLIVAANQDVTLQTPFEDGSFDASPNQQLLTGTTVTTGANSFAELQLGQNVLRMDENTTLTLESNHFEYSAETPRLVFKLDSGGVWVNSFDPLVVKDDHVQAHFDHSIGSFSYTDPLNRLMSLVGYIDLQLFDTADQIVTDFTVPLRNQVTFVDSQLIPDYAQLEYSKLKKELKMGPVAASVYDDAWVKRNLRDDSLLLVSNGSIFSANSYRVQNRWLNFRKRLTFLSSAKEALDLQSVKLKLSYLLGGVHRDGDKALAEELLAEIDEVVAGRMDEPAVRELIENQFFGIQNAEINSVAHIVKEDFRERLLAYKSPEFYRHYLVEMDRFLRANQVEEAEVVLTAWLDQWRAGLRTEHMKEFTLQSRLYHSMVLAYNDRVSNEFVNRLDDLGDQRLEQADYSEDVLFEVALERLEVSRALVAAGRYESAKSYLKTSYAGLGLAQSEASVAARDLFLKEANLLAERIAFAEETLRSAAEPLNEAEFKDYLAAQERDRDLEERFLELVGRTAIVEEVIEAPTIAEVIQRFNEQRIIVIDTDVEPIEGRGFEFNIREGRLIERTADGEAIVFNGVYDYSSNVLHELTVNDQSLRGNFTLRDFVLVAKNIDQEILPSDLPATDVVGVVDFLSESERDEADRSQLVAQDLAIQLMIKQLEELNIFVGSPTQVVVIDPVQLNQFNVRAVSITDPVSDRTVKVDFDYHTGTRLISNITSEDAVLDLSTVTVEAFSEAVFTQVFENEQRSQAAGSTKQLFTNLGLSVADNDLNFVDEQLTQIAFENARMRQMPITLSGVYDRDQGLLVNVASDYHSDTNVTFDEFLPAASQAYVIGFLSDQNIAIGPENIVTSLPSDRVSIAGYVRGDKIIDFVFDVPNNRLLQIQLEGIDVVVDSMSFEEFALIEGVSIQEESSEPETAEEEVATDESPEEVEEELIDETPEQIEGDEDEVEPSSEEPSEEI